LSPAGSAAFQPRRGEKLVRKNPPFVKLDCPPEVIPRLGKVSDRQIAREQNCHPETVQVWRRERGIAACTPEQQHPKRIHPVTCDWCKKPFVIVGGRGDRLRRTHPPPKKCQWKQAQKTRRLRKSKTNMRQLRGLMERHILRDN
jgi:hypothetical protein